MKKILFLILVFINVNLMGQERNYAKRENGDLILSNVEVVEGASAKDLYKRAISWVSDTYKNPKSVIQTQDADAGILLIKGLDKNNYEHKLKFEFKDGKYRWNIYDIYATFSALLNIAPKRIERTPRFSKKVEEDNLNTLMSDFSSYIESFQKKMMQKDDW